MIATSSQSILLDASNSYDRTNPNAILYFEWDCIDIIFPTLECPLKNENLLSSESTQLISPYSLLSGHTYLWKVIVHSGNNYAYDSLHLILSTISVPSISISINPPGKLYSSATILITSSSNEEIMNWNWVSLDNKLDISNLYISSTKNNSILQIPPQSVIGDTNIYISGTTIDGRIGTHVESLSITSTSNGYCSISPSSNSMSISSNFTVFCSSWHDIYGGNSRDLQYQFSYFDENGIQVFISQIDKKQSQEIYLPDQKSSSINLYANIFSSSNNNNQQQQLQSSFDFTLYPMAYISSSLSNYEITSRLQSAKFVADNWPNFYNISSEEISNYKCYEPICALNILAIFASSPVYNSQRPIEMPSVEDILDIFIPIFENTNIQINDTYIGIYTSILYDLGIRSDTKLNSLQNIGEMLLVLSNSLRNNANDNNMISNSQNIFACHQSIINILNYWLENRILQYQNEEKSNEIRLLIREIITSIQLSISQEKYFTSCEENEDQQQSITLSSNSIIISISRGTFEDLQTSSRVSLSYKSATFILPGVFKELINNDENCLFWNRGVFSPLLYPQKENQCTQYITELSILTFDGSQMLEISFDDENPISISFPKNNDCSTSHNNLLCYTNDNFNSNLEWNKNKQNCPFDNDSGSKYKYNSYHLGDFTLAFIPNEISSISSDNDHSSNDKSSSSDNNGLSNSKSSSNLTEDDNDSSQLSSDELGINRLLFFFIIFLCIFIGIVLTVIVISFIISVRRKAASLKKARVDDFAIEMDEFNFNDDFDDDNNNNTPGNVKEKPQNNLKGTVDNILSPIKNLFKSNNSSFMDDENLYDDDEELQDDHLVSNDQKQIEKEESTFAIQNEKSNSIFDDPDEDSKALVPNPAKKEKKSEESRLVVEANTISEEDDEDYDF